MHGGVRHPARAPAAMFRSWLLWAGLGESAGFLAPAPGWTQAASSAVRSRQQVESAR
ncbi:hypothetical protein RCH16_002968 [Cryobacterium sp. MP_M5]|nr:hypothetical protein [Cryobacterium sp. MP_M3]MEC5177942.1 hypothetical protein [Cryobacterium sp. MP_M5]